MTASLGQLSTRAVLQAATESETAFGGRTVAWNDVAVLWVALSAERVAERAPGGREARDAAAPERLERTAVAEAREHPAAARGMRLVVEGVGWRVVSVERVSGGRMRLRLAAE